ncbi:competence protein ComJ [Agrobacterium bohemicum]|uniref:Uncharacterized protein n=1 Tax=Agrobacterium bohemicum TaxID=2052828 RepID=A0A135P103_9HYPH|nr:competence protein ComJ [Agrobacterium bohemicum]KXG85090.1 hypothetical protein ATO67_10765 [Agrobacterium bohemicum]
MAEIFPLFVSYQQLAVFNHSLDNPFNDWKPRHVSQGFSWRAESVSFRVPEGENYIVEVLQDSEVSALIGEPSRIILTPFLRIRDNSVTVGSITEENSILIDEAAKYQLSFELLRRGVYEEKEFEHGIRLRFVKEENPIFEIRKADDEMDASSELELVAQPAE